MPVTVLPSSCKSVGSSCGTWPVCGCRAFSTAPRAQGAASSASEAHGEELGQKASMWEPWLRFKPQPQPMRAPRSSRQREGPGQGDRRPWPLPPSPRNSASPVSSANPDKCLSIKWKRRFPARTRRGPGGRCPAAPPLALANADGVGSSAGKHLRWSQYAPHVEQRRALLRAEKSSVCGAIVRNLHCSKDRFVHLVLVKSRVILFRIKQTPNCVIGPWTPDVLWCLPPQGCLFPEGGSLLPASPRR